MQVRRCKLGDELILHYEKEGKRREENPGEDRAHIFWGGTLESNRIMLRS